MSDKSARERFVEAMKAIAPWLKMVETANSDLFTRHLMDAVHAFADAECDAFQDGETGEWCGRHCRLNDGSHEGVCRAALRREVFGE